jgi:hypothetical protein
MVEPPELTWRLQNAMEAKRSIGCRALDLEVPRRRRLTEADGSTAWRQRSDMRPDNRLINLVRTPHRCQLPSAWCRAVWAAIRDHRHVSTI